MNIPEKIKELESINESHRKLNGELRERIKELEEEYKKLLATSAESTKKLLELIPTKEEVRYIKHCMVEITNGFCATCENSILAKLQKIIEKEK